MKVKNVACCLVAFGFLLIMGLVACSSTPTAAPPAGSAAQPPASKAQGIKANGRVAIFDFAVKGGGDSFASLRGDIPESLSEAFIKGGLVVPVERRDLDKALAEQELSLSGLVDDATAARVGRLAGARYALLGSASIIDVQIRLSCRLIDIETGEILYATSVHGETKKIYTVLEELAGEVEDGFKK